MYKDNVTVVTSTLVPEIMVMNETIKPNVKENVVIINKIDENITVCNKGNCKLWCDTIGCGIISCLTCFGCCGSIKSPDFIFSKKEVKIAENNTEKRVYNCINWFTISVFSNIYLPFSCCGCCCGFCCILSPRELATVSKEGMK